PGAGGALRFPAGRLPVGCVLGLAVGEGQDDPGSRGGRGGRGGGQAAGGRVPGRRRAVEPGDAVRRVPVGGGGAGGGYGRGPDVVERSAAGGHESLSGVARREPRGDRVLSQRPRVAAGLLGADPALVPVSARSEEHTSELQSRENLVYRLLL